MKKIAAAQKFPTPPPHNFSNGPSLTSMYKMYKFFTFLKTYKSVDVSVPSCQLQLDI